MGCFLRRNPVFMRVWSKVLFIAPKRIKVWYNTNVVAPNLATERGVYMSEIISFLISVLASVVGYYICKWLDGDDSDN